MKPGGRWHLRISWKPQWKISEFFEQIGHRQKAWENSAHPVFSAFKLSHEVSDNSPLKESWAVFSRCIALLVIYLYNKVKKNVNSR